MDILKEPPPNYDEVVKTFDLKGYKPIFAWGNRIYNPWAVDLSETPQLIAHEMMHGFRQLGRTPDAMEMTPADITKINLWWRDYIDSKGFRLEEEIPAHRAEYRELLRMHGNTRKNRRRFLRETAARLRSPLYGYNRLFTFDQAMGYLSLDETEWQG